jgi:ferrous iron transport protein B
MHKIALAGNPNCGKTTLFNLITGSNQYVGNWAGVTVEKKVGRTKVGHSEIVDLPGIYSLSPYTLEEIVARDYILYDRPEAIINIIDGTNIERNLYLTIQLLELQRPMVIAINMMDEVKAKGDTIDCDLLSHFLGATVIPISAKKGDNIDKVVKEAEHLAHNQDFYSQNIVYDNTTQEALYDIMMIISENKYPKETPLTFFASKLLEDDIEAKKKLNLSAAQSLKIEEIVKAYENTSEYGDRETMLADARYKLIEGIVKKCVKKNSSPETLTVSDKIDKIVTNRILAIPIFLVIMMFMFMLTFGDVGTFLSGLIDSFFVDFLTPMVEQVLANAQSPEWTRGLLVDAVIGGVGGVLTFLPQIMILFLFLSLLEDSGYMARAAFIMDKLLHKLGLSGKSFIPMLMGFGCTTPAVMATRTLENEKDRKMTIMLTSYMSCGARLTIYALFAGIFFKENQGFIIFSMYLLGMVVAILTGIILKKTVFKGTHSPFILELPPYRFPGIKTTLLHLWDKCRGFIVKAGTIIFSMSIIIWGLQNFNFSFEMVTQSNESIFGLIGGYISPIFTPLGFGTWEASISLLTGLVAKESVVSSMSVLYGINGVRDAFNPASAYAFMVFSLLYVPCISAFVAIKKEMGSLKWALATALMQIATAYFVAFIAYQILSRVL